MEKETREIIARVVDRIRDHFRISPENIKNIGWQQIIEDLGGRLVEDANLFCDARISKLDSNEGVYFEIRVLPSQPQTRINFSIAHELGHLFLHMLFRINYDKWSSIPIGESYNRMGNGELEIQANEFAAELLMPKGEFISILNANRIDTTNSYNIEPVAAYFGVSEQAILNRGRWLGVLAW